VVDDLPKTSAYFRAYRKQLLARSTYKQRQSVAPEYVIYNVGAYTFAPYKVVWAELSKTFEAAVVTSAEMPNGCNRVFVPDHKIYFADFTDEAKAHYVCALLNSSLVREYVQSHTIQIQVSNIFKHLSLPEFEPKDGNHKNLAKFCKDAHSAKTEVKRVELLAAMDKISERLLTAS